jgi:flavin reductase (DIM6/NTAB) family NADH-FMN oxidoreductase RutF
MTIDPTQTTVKDFIAFLQGAVVPRPIALASTIDLAGNVNLSPFSFFNVFSANPPILVFSPSRRVRDNTTKHTLENILQTKEVVINLVSYAMAEQTSLASTEYDKGVNEFVKAGFASEPSVRVKPPRVRESPVSFECKVNSVMPLGDQGGAGNLVICEVLLAHAHDYIFNEQGEIDPRKIDLVARMGAQYYCRAGGQTVFEIPKPLTKKGIGVDQLPNEIKNSVVLTGNNLARLANVENLPSSEEIKEFSTSSELVALLQNDAGDKIVKLHQYAQHLLEKGELKKAWMVLLTGSGSRREMI